MIPRRGTRGLGAALSRRGVLAVAIVVVVLVIVDVVLVTIALGRTAPESHGEPGPIPTFTSSPGVGDQSTPSASAAADPENATDTAAGRLLSALTGREAWRASRGSCDGTGAVLEHTVDGGATWRAVAAGTGVQTIEALRATDAGVSVRVGTGADCAASVRTSTDGGDTWQAGTAGAAGPAVGDGTVVLASGSEPSPCDDTEQVFQGERTTAVVCDGGLQWRTGQGAWVGVPVDGLRSLALDGSSYTLARVGVDGCTGVQVDSIPASGLTPSSTTSPVGCADAATDGGAVVARAAGSLWLWAGDDVMVSADNGASW